MIFKKTSARQPEESGHPWVSNMDVMKVIEIQEFDDLLQFHESIWIQYCWVGCRPVERRWVESLSGVSLSSGWTSDRSGRSTVLLPGSRLSCLPGIYLKHQQRDVFWWLEILPWTLELLRCNVAKHTCSKPLLDEREAVSRPGQLNITAWKCAALTGELHRQGSRLTGAFGQLESC